MQKICLNFNSLKQWFLKHKRSFPWREEITPYRVWVSEVMLQQTQAEVVIPYFLRWMEKFPEIEVLAKASEDEVIKIWEGLGYYSRARNLLLGAKQILTDFKGKIPHTKADLSKIKGIGPYTAGAILNFAFHEKAAALDGNALRVLTRILNYQKDLSKASALKELYGFAEAFLTEEEPWIISEALIELGATICKKKPKCQSCPLINNCQAFLKNNIHEVPYKSSKNKVTPLLRSVAVLYSQGKFLVKKEEDRKIMAGLFQFPFLDGDLKELQNWVCEKFSSKILRIQPLPLEKHSFTRFRVKLSPMLFLLEKLEHLEGYCWLTLTELKKRAFSSGHRKILRNLLTLTILSDSKN